MNVLLVLSACVVATFASPISQEGDCTCGGDPFYKTLDGEKLEFQGKCSYLLMGTVDSKLPADIFPFKIYVHNTKAMGSERAYTQKVHIDARYHRISLREQGVLEVDEVNQQTALDNSDGMVEISAADGLRAGKMGPSTYFQMDRMMRVDFDGRGPSGRHVANVKLLDSRYQGRVEGMCGNWNGNGTDDHQPKDSPNSSRPYTDTEVGNSWLIDAFECL